MNRGAVIFLLMLIAMVQTSSAQEVYNNCNSALEICPNSSYSLNNIGSNVTFCPSCEDDFNYCFPTDNTIWTSFTTNTLGGDVQIDFTNLIFENNPNQDNELQATIIEALVQCDAGTYTQIGNCVSNATGNFSLNAMGLTPNTTYYIVIDGDNSGVGITSPAECTFDLSITGTAVDRPAATITVSSSAPNACLNDIIVYTADTTNCPDGGDFQWFVNGVLSATTTTGIFQTSSLVDGDVVSVKTTCYTVCIDTIEAVGAPQNVYAFNVDAGADLTIGEGEVVQLFGNTTAPDFSWSPSFLVSSTTALNPIANPTETTTFTLTATENGCTLSDDVTIFVTTEMVIPNTFSPNDDGANETWVINGIEKFPDNLVRVYDRWGQKVFEASGYSEVKAWDGSVRSKTLSESVYYYVIELRDGSDEIRKGSLTIIR